MRRVINPVEVHAMSKIDFRNVERDPSRCGGRAVVGGTRIPVAIVLGCYRLSMTVEEIVQQYPSLRCSDVHDALAYAYEHMAEMEADITANQESTVKARFIERGFCI